VKHKWKTIRASDYNDLVNAANVLYGQGLGLLGEHPELLFDMLGLDKKVLEEKNPQQQKLPPNSQQSSNPKNTQPLPGQEQVNPNGSQSPASE
jgi:hypothetical protein